MNTTITNTLTESHHLFTEGRLNEAQQLLMQLLDHDPHCAEAWSNLGYIYYLQSHINQAIDACEQAIASDPQCIAAHSNLGMALVAVSRIDDAITVLKNGLKINPAFAEIHVNIGIAYQRRHHLTDAISHLQYAIQLNPTRVEAYCNLASCFQDCARIDHAEDLYERVLTMNAQHIPSISNLQMCLQYSKEKTSQQLLSTAIRVSQPLNSLTQQKSTQSRQKTTQKMRIGFVSADFREHPVGRFFIHVLAQLVQRLDAAICYYNGLQEDTLTEQFKQTATQFRAVSGLSDDQLRDMINADAIDVLIDLSGHTAGNRLGVFALGAAPVQMSWLGYPATTAIENMDAVILSDDLITESTPHFFTERIERLNCSQFVYSPPDYMPEVNRCPHERNHFITFGCFNNTAKLNDRVLVTWAKILHQVPDSRLILKWKSFDDAQVADAFFRRFHSLGINRDRLELRGASSHAKMLAEYGDIDIALDPFPFSGALTSFEAVWMGVPVITLYGERPISRQTYSLNKSLQRDDLCAETPSDYIRKAADLAMDKNRLAKLRETLRDNAIKSSASQEKNMVNQLLDLFAHTAN